MTTTLVEGNPRGADRPGRTPCAPATVPGRHRQQRQAGVRRSRHRCGADSADADNVVNRPRDRPAPTTTSCSTRTTSPATAASTRTSASPPSTPSSTPSTTAWSSTPRTYGAGRQRRPPSSTSGCWRRSRLPTCRPPQSGSPRVERRAPVPGREVRHRDAVPAPGVRGVRAHRPADGRRVPAPTGYDTTIDPAIVAEFAHTVYRFGHSMLIETVDRFDPNFNPSTNRTSDDADRPDRGVPQPARVRDQRPDAGGGDRRHRARHDAPGRQRDRRVRHRGAAQQPAGPSARPRRASTLRAAATPGFRRSTMRAPILRG